MRSTMFKKVIIPIDFSDDSQYVVRCLSKIPQIREVVLLNITKSLYLVRQPETVNPDVDYARLRLEELKKIIHMPRSKIRGLVEEISGGSIAEIINNVSIREDVSLVMMGRRGRSVIESLLIGSTASELLKYGTKNLLLIHPPGTENDRGVLTVPCPDPFSKILICTDFSRPEIEQLCVADMITNRSVVLFHVISTGDSNDEVQENIKLAKENLEKIKDKLIRHTKEIHTEVVIGDPAQEILAYSEHEDVSMIVIKSTGEKNFIRNLLGTTAESVARTTQKPVLILRQRDSESCQG